MIDGERVPAGCAAGGHRGRHAQVGHAAHAHLAGGAAVAHAGVLRVLDHRPTAD